MNKVTVDACGLACPQPVVEVKKAIEKNPGSVIEITVDDSAAEENICRFAKAMGYDSNVNGSVSGVKTIVIIPSEINIGQLKSDISVSSSPDIKPVIFIKTDFIGTGDDDLGRLLMKTFFQTMLQSEKYPASIILMHRGVRLAIENADTLPALKKLTGKGISLFVCGTCLDYYGLKQKLAAGSISNFFEIYSLLAGASKVISI